MSTSDKGAGGVCKIILKFSSAEADISAMLVDNSQPKVNVRLFVVGRVNSENTLEGFFGKVVRGVSVIQNSNSVPVGYILYPQEVAVLADKQHKSREGYPLMR